MKVKTLKNNGLSHELEITVSANDIDKRIDERLQEVSKTIKVQGFRPGKVPLAMLKKRYGKAVLGEVLELVVNETSEKALNDNKLRPALQPKIEVKKFEDGQDLVYTVSVEVLPEIKIADFKGLKLEKPTAKPDETSVADSLARLAEYNKSTQAVTEKRAAKKGDTLVMDFHGRTADDNKEHPGMHAHGHQLELGSGQFIPGFEDQLIGAKAGEKVEVKVSFPANYGAKELAGRDAIFDVQVHELREPMESKIDDELAKSLGLADLEALKKAIEGQLQAELNEHSRMNLKKNLLDQLDVMHKFEIPAGMLDMEYNNVIEQIEMERKRYGETEEMTDAEKAEMREISERRVRLGLILSEVGRNNNIMVSDSELHRAVINEAQKYRGQEKQVFDYYAKNRHALESLRAPIFEDKVVDYILELAQVTEKEMDAKALLSLLEGEEESKADSKPAKKSSAEKSDAPKKKAAAKK